MKARISEIDGQIYYQCEECGAVGNWPEFIQSEMCHKDKDFDLTLLKKETNNGKS